MNTDTGKSIFWRRMAPKLKSMANEDSLKEFKKRIKQKKAKKVTPTQTLSDKLKKQTQKLADTRKKTCWKYYGTAR